ncbi:inositol 2-dehydrogenase-like isoform X3 [Rhinoraja longicauda]
MGRKKKSLHDYAAEFCDLSVKRHIVEQKEGGVRDLVEILYCKSCEIPMSARRDRILEHLASARHYRNKRLEKHTSARLHATTLLIVSGVIICSLAEEGSEVVLDALRAGKGVFCEKLLSLDKQIAESCFDEAARVGKPLVCGLYKRFDPAVQFLYKKVHNKALGRIQRIISVSKTYPSPALSYIKKTGGIFYEGVVHDLDTVCWILGENAPDTIFSLGHAFCQEIAALKDADAVSVSMKFASGAIVTLDVSQHCTLSNDQRLEVHGSEGTLKMENQNALGITEQGTARPVCSHLYSDRYRDAYRELLKHFLKTLRGKEQPFITKENFLWTIQVAAAAEQSWRNGSAVDLRNEPLDGTVIKTEVP